MEEVKIKNQKSKIKIFNFALSFCILMFGFWISLNPVFAQDDQNPINITFVIHFDPLFAPGGEVPKESYEKERDNLAWLSNYLESLEKEKGAEFIPRLTSEIGGDHAEFYSEDETGFKLLKKFYNKRIHSFGTHFHTNYKEGKHIWPQAQQRNEPRRQNNQIPARVTDDHIKEVDALVAKIIGSKDTQEIRKANHIITGHLLDDVLAESLGFDIKTGGTNEVFNLFFDHDVYNPFRPQKRGWHLTEDKDGDWFLIPQSPVLGNIAEHSPIPRGISSEYTQGMQRMIWQDLSIAAMKRKFLHLYLEWLYQTKNNLPQKVWVFGWHEHTNNIYKDDGAYGNARNLRDEVVEFISWLNDNFINKRTKDGTIIAKYANAEEVVNEFLEWENKFPNQSSFDYPTQERDWEIYPYELKGLSWGLMYSHYEKEIPDFKNLGVHPVRDRTPTASDACLRQSVSNGVNVHKLIRTDGRNWDYENGKVVCFGSTEEIYLIWSDEGQKTIDASISLSIPSTSLGTVSLSNRNPERSRRIDFSKYIKGKVECIDGLTGESKIQPSKELKVSETPIICRVFAKKE